MKVIKKQIMDVHFDPSNVRKHNAKNLEAIKASLARFGQQKPIVIDGKDIVRAGNGTLEAARELGWSEIDCVYSELEGSELTAFAIADNRTAELAEWDVDSLSLQLKSFDEELRNIAYDEFDFPDEPIEPSERDDAIPDVLENEMGVELGDLWELGSHRLLCGDSTDKAMVDILMGGEKADMVFTDPPYGMNLDTDFSKLKKYTERHKGKTATGRIKIERKNNNYKSIYGDDQQFDASFLIDMSKEVFLWGADYYRESIPSGGGWIVWDKKTTDGLQKMFGSDFELCWSKTIHERKIFRHTWSSFFGFDKKNDGAKRVHPTQKPVLLCENMISQYGSDGDLVVDLFLGSGSTLIACEKTGRKCYGSEIDPHYCSVIIKRWEEFTGKKARRLKV